MYYEINVTESYKGSDGVTRSRHYFATSDRSITDLGKLKRVLIDFRDRFPFDEGFRMSVSQRMKTGRELNIDELLLDEPVERFVEEG